MSDDGSVPKLTLLRPIAAGLAWSFGRKTREAVEIRMSVYGACIASSLSSLVSLPPSTSGGSFRATITL